MYEDQEVFVAKGIMFAYVTFKRYDGDDVVVLFRTGFEAPLDAKHVFENETDARKVWREFNNIKEV